MLNRINFRDFGGGRTVDDRTIRRAILYRSGVWQKINASDRDYLESLHIQYVIDFRSLEEQERDPANLPGKNRVSLPCNIDRMTRERLRPLLLKRFADEQIIDVIDGTYSEMVALMAGPMGDLIRLMLQPDGLPVLIHCRAGKDRTGFAAAMIQWFLGLDRKSIMDEYLKSNDFMGPRISKLLKRVRLFTMGLFPKGNLQAAFEVRARYLDTAMDKVDSEYGGVVPYLMSTGITPEELDRLKNRLLE
jgi:protein-tyrosine phosphatase